MGQLDGCNGRNDLRSYRADLACGRCKGHERILLDLVLCVVIESKPAVGVVGLPRDFL